MFEICLVGHKGYWAQYLLRNLAQTPGVRVTALVDQLDDLRTGDPVHAPSLEVALSYAGFDAVVVATPPETHYELVKEAIEAGKHVLVEKPMTTCSAQARELCELADKKGVRLGVDHTFLFSNHIRVIRNLIQNDEIGEVLRISSSRLNLGKFQNSGVVWDLAPHDLAMTNYLMDGQAEVRSARLQSHIDEGVVDTASIDMAYGRTSYSLELSWLWPKKTRYTAILGTKGMIEFDMLAESPLVIYDKRASKSESVWLHSYTWKNEFRGECREPLAVLCEEFRDWCLNGGEFISDGEVGVKVVEGIEAISFKALNREHCQ